MDTVCAPLAFIDGLGGPEMMLIFVIILVLFGGQKLPEFARGLGKTMREFKKAASGVEEEFKRALEEDERKRTVAAPPQSTTPAITSGSENSPGYGSEDPHGYENQDDVYSDAGPDAPAQDTWPKADSTAPTPEQPAESTATAETPPEKNPANSESIPSSDSGATAETVPASETRPADVPSGATEKKLPLATPVDEPKP